jgi:glycosyltransferase involved in cell wall biosynthesis
MTNGVSCLCLTYGRPQLLEEAIESFLRQTWQGPKELIVLNDHPEQTLRCDSPNVEVFNINRRLKTLGEKRNLSVALAKYENLFVWDDDDIYLPWRIEETMKKLPKDQFFKCPNAWVMNNGKIDKDPGYNLFHGGTAFTRWLFEKVKGYAMMNGGEDADLEGRFQHITDTKGEYWPHTRLPSSRLYYIYRWSHGSYHTTGHSSLDEIKPKVQPGEINLLPKWHLPYDDLALEAAGIKKVVSKKADMHFITFSKNRPLQLDGYIRSFHYAMGDSPTALSVLYKCDPKYQPAYDEIIKSNPNVCFIKEKVFYNDLLS